MTLSGLRENEQGARHMSGIPPPRGAVPGMGDDGRVANMRGRQTVWDMVLSMAAIGAVVAGVYFFLPHNEGDPVKTVSYTVELGQARRSAPSRSPPRWASARTGAPPR